MIARDGEGQRRRRRRRRPGRLHRDLPADDHDHPTYEVHGVVHYCVANMPGAVAQTSTWALTNTTIGYADAIANNGHRARAGARPPRLSWASTPTAGT